MVYKGPTNSENDYLHGCLLASSSTSHISCTPSLKITALYSISPLFESNTAVGSSATSASCGVIRWYVSVVPVPAAVGERDVEALG